MGNVTDTETAGNARETLSDDEIAGRLDHIDEMLHEQRRTLEDIAAFIDEHRPALARGLALMGAGSKLGMWRKAGKDG